MNDDKGLVERLNTDADEIEGWGGGNEAATVREAAARIQVLSDRIADGTALLTELLDGPSKGEFFGISETLRNKLLTVRAALTPQESSSNAE